MTKISEKVFDQDGKLVVQEKHNFHQATEIAKTLKSNGMYGFGESKLVGIVPMKMWHEWAKKWGVSPGDNAAMREVVARELQDRDNAHLRVWEGKY